MPFIHPLKKILMDIQRNYCFFATSLVLQTLLCRYIYIYISTYPRRILERYTTPMYPQSSVKVKMTMPTAEAAYTASAVSLNLWVRSKIRPHKTEPAIPATTITRPMRPASWLAPWRSAKNGSLFRCFIRTFNGRF